MKKFIAIMAFVIGTQAAFANVQRAAVVAQRALKSQKINFLKEYRTVYVFTRVINSQCFLEVAVTKQGYKAVSPNDVAELGPEIDKASNYYNIEDVGGNLIKVCDPY